MDEIRKKIAHLTQKLQFQGEVPLWSLANEHVISGVAVGKKPVWGKKSKLFWRIMQVAYMIKMADMTIFCMGLYQSVSIWLLVKKHRAKATQMNTIKRVFVCFGASSEDYLYANYLKQSQDVTIKINSINHEGLHQLGCPDFSSIFSELLRNSFGHTKKLARAPHEVCSNIIDFLTICALNNGPYTFYRAYWLMAKKQSVTEVAFLAPDIPGFACEESKIRSVCFQHGLMGLGILLPKFDWIEGVTPDECLYLKTAFKYHQVGQRNIKTDNADFKTNTLMMLSLNVSIEDRLKDAAQLIEWAQDVGLNIVIRPIISATKEEQLTLQSAYPLALLDNPEMSLEDSLEKWKPKLVAAWTSTGLFTALNFGYIPISLCDPQEKHSRWTMIYPMRQRVLFWPRDKVVLENALAVEEMYSSTISQLRNTMDTMLIAEQL